MVCHFQHRRLMSHNQAKFWSNARSAGGRAITLLTGQSVGLLVIAIGAIGSIDQAMLNAAADFEPEIGGSPNVQLIRG